MSGKFERGCRVVLLAEDDLEMRLLLSKVLQKEGCSVIECRDGIDLYERVSPLLNGNYDMEYDLIVTDLRMPIMTGMEVIEGLSDLKKVPPVVAIMSSGDALYRNRLRRLGVSSIIDKPFNIEDFKRVIRDTVMASESGRIKTDKPVTDGIRGH